MKILINGIGIAGPTLAYWLRRFGHEPVLVEQAPGLRRGGYVVDFWGVGYDIAERMDLLPRIHSRGYQVKEVRFVDGEGQTTGGFSADVFSRITGGRFTSLHRSELSAAIYGAVEDQVETRFGDGVVAIEQHAERARVQFEQSQAGYFDVVVGADGLHSQVRRLVFGPPGRFETYLGYHVAAFEVLGYQPRDELVYVSHAQPGRQVSRFSMRSDKTLFLFVFREDDSNAPVPVGTAERKAAVRRVFGDMKWEVPQILAAMDQASGIYFDRVSQIRMERWAERKVALVGDAAACVSLLAGEGTGLAMVEAYVLAGELHRARGDYASAFARYHERLMPFLRAKQKSAARFASSFAPATAMGIAMRNLVMRAMGIPMVADYFIGRDLRDDFELPEYE